MDKRLSRIEETLDKHQDILLQISKILERNTISLEEHVRRTNLLQEEVSILKDEIKPLQHIMVYVNLSFKILGSIASLLLLVKVIIDILHLF